MPYATSIACTEGGFNERLSQMSLNLYKRVAYEEYGGLAVNKSEGDRMAGNIGDKAVIMLKNHGVLVMAKTMAMAIYDLYFLERAAKVQVLAESTGKPLTLIPEDIAELTYRQLAVQGEDKESYFKMMKRLLDENSPEYKDL